MATLTQLPFDIERELASNEFTNEIHDVTTANGKVNRVILPEFGAFFTESVSVRDVNGVAIERHKGMELTYHYELFSEAAGQGVSALIVITDQARRGPFSVTYHAVGGNFALSYTQLKDVIDLIENSKEKIKWEDIIDKPTAYVPEAHTHKYWQLYGMDSVVTALNRLGDSWAVGRGPIIGALRGYYDDYLEDMQKAIDDYTARVIAHITDRSNPHLTDKYKVNLGNINNWALASYIESIDVSNHTKYQSIGGVYSQLQAYAIPILDAHVKDRAAVGKPDPHNLTLSQLGVYSKDEIDALFRLRLARNQYAYNTEQLVGLSFQTFYDNLRASFDIVLDVDQTTRFTIDQLGRRADVVTIDKCALQSDNNWVPFESLIKEFNSTQGSIIKLRASGSVQAMINEAAAMDVSAGTYFIGNYSKYYHDIPIWGTAVFQRSADNKSTVLLIA